MNNAERNFIFTNATQLQVGTIYCIGRNYSAHALEMGAEVPEKPLVFIKPPAAYVFGDNAIIDRPEYSQAPNQKQCGNPASPRQSAGVPCRYQSRKDYFRPEKPLPCEA